jgi:FKBP-type peptidyl-prolyl cis-trans isomerase FkpA
MRFVVIAAAVLALAGCQRDQKSIVADTAVTPGATMSMQEAAGLSRANAFLARNRSEPGVQVTESGLQYKVVRAGPGSAAAPTADDVVCVMYEGALTDGQVFDSSYQRGAPIDFPLSGVIPGWTQGLQLMKPGDMFMLYVPPELGYGQTGTPGGPIGPNEALVFKVELLNVGGC